MGKTAEREAYLLAGATASGKSAAAAILAREMGAAILSADSMLVYKGMDIGTAKPSAGERAEFSMGGVDVVTPAEDFSAGAWLRAAAAWIETIPESKPVVIVGGTGLYFSALLRGLDRAWVKPPPEYPVLQIERSAVRERIAARLDAMFMQGLEEEKKALREKYPVEDGVSCDRIPRRRHAREDFRPHLPTRETPGHLVQASGDGNLRAGGGDGGRDRCKCPRSLENPRTLEGEVRRCFLRSRISA